MKPPLLVLDVHYLCHRAFHSQGKLSWDGVATGVVFGFLKSIGSLKAEFQTDRVAFCFEGPWLHRTKDFPAYKSKRGLMNKTPEELKARNELHSQIHALQTEYLPCIGFRNIFLEPGFESDDLMATISEKETGDVILVTSDADMFQCLRPNVRMYCASKKKIYTEGWFRKEYGIEPRDWAMVKAIAGCGTDGVPGIYGVGEKTAIKFLHDELDPNSKTYRDIMCVGGKMIVRRNRKLVELPYKDCPIPKIQEDEIDRTGWEVVCENLGFKSLAGRPPVYIQQRRII
jgi:5'-3' exonuclease